MASKQVVDKQKSAKTVEAAAETNAQAIATKLAAELSPHLAQGEAMPDIELFVRLIGRSIGAAAREMVRTDEAHSAELADDEPPRTARDEVAGRIYARLVAMRDSAAGLYGLDVARRLGFTSKTPQDPEMLVRFAKEVIAGVGRTTLGKPRIESIAPLDLTPEVAHLVADVALLEGHLTDVARELREAQATRCARDGASASYETRFAHGATTLEALLRGSDLGDLADRVRPSARRPGHTIEGDDETPVESPTRATGED